MGLFRTLKYKLSLRRWVEAENLIGKNVNIGKNTVVKGSKIIGNVKIGSDCRIKQVEIVGGDIEIGNFNSLWGPNIDFHAQLNPIKIGNYCSIGRHVSFQEFNHDHGRFSTYFMNQNLLKNGSHREDIISKGAIIIEHDVWIGTQCVILGGAHISTGAVIAANSVVAGFVPPYAVVAGTPAKILKYRFDEITIERLLATQWWNWSKEKLKKEMPNLNAMVSTKK